MSVRAMLMRHRPAIQDIAFVAGIILLAGFGAYEFTFTGSVEADKRIDFEEMLALGAVVVISILYLGWRRVRAQEHEINRRIAAERRAHELAHTDPLTGLANRRQFEAAVTTALHGRLLLSADRSKRIAGQAAGLTVPPLP